MSDTTATNEIFTTDAGLNALLCGESLTAARFEVARSVFGPNDQPVLFGHLAIETAYVPGAESDILKLDPAQIYGVRPSRVDRIWFAEQVLQGPMAGLANTVTVAFDPVTGAVTAMFLHIEEHDGEDDSGPCFTGGPAREEPIAPIHWAPVATMTPSLLWPEGFRPTQPARLDAPVQPPIQDAALAAAHRQCPTFSRRGLMPGEAAALQDWKGLEAWAEGEGVIGACPCQTFAKRSTLYDISKGIVDRIAGRDAADETGRPDHGGAPRQRLSRWDVVWMVGACLAAIYVIARLSWAIPRILTP
ncbi:hypothetical protein V7S57_02270 [Caulobacter sp. CCNWLY153]|uniref:hypothetical protein n=1 Tax=unclassified Caulobacter TaxID=2648921 RepID=UPI002FEF0851